MSSASSENHGNIYPPSLVLRAVQLIHRHGARTAGLTRLGNSHPVTWTCPITNQPLEMYRQSLHGGESDVPNRFTAMFRSAYIAGHQAIAGTCHSGQLTEQGFRDLAILGREMRDLYVHRLGLVSSLYDSSQIWVRSTVVTRAKESAHSLIIAMFKLDKPATSGDAKTNVVIDVHHLQERVENMYPDSSRCKRLSQITKEFRQSSNYVRLQSATMEIRNRVSDILGVPEKDLPSTHGLYDEFSCRAAHGITLPSGITASLIRELGVASMKAWFLPYASIHEVARLGIGRFISDLVSDLSGVRLGRDSRRFFVYSGHDTTLVPLLVAFNGLPDEWPDFASSLAVELFSEKADEMKPVVDQRHWVRLIYRHGPKGSPEALSIPDCSGSTRDGSSGTMCDYARFKQIANRYVPRDFKVECTPKADKSTAKEGG